MTIERGPTLGGSIAALTDGAEIIWDCSQGFTYSLAISGNHTLLPPTGLVDGSEYFLLLTLNQHTLTFTPGGGYAFGSGNIPTLSSGAGGAVDVLRFLARNDELIFMGAVLNVGSVPLTPTLLTASANKYGSIDLAWTNNDTENPVRVERFDGAFWGNVGSDLPAGTAIFTDTISPGNYQYRVKSVKANGIASAASNTATGTSLLHEPILTAVPSVSGPGVDLSWPENTEATDYRVQRKSGTDPFTDLVTTPAFSYDDTDGTPEAGPYTYRVYAQIDGSPVFESAASNEATSAFATGD